jgi:putative two-component system response regulator
LHDIGKVAIPDAILRKPGPLSDEEREQMQQHTMIGEQILNRLALQEPGVSFFRMAAEIARWHHESFDGTGYPDGLRGTTIPLAARIVKVADVFDALTSARVYKQACDPSTALTRMTGAEVDSFDPQVIAAMLRVFDEFADVSQHPDSVEIQQFAAHYTQTTL